MSAAGAAGALIALQSSQKHREVIAFFEAHGALEPSRAIEVPPETRLSQATVAEMVRHGDLVEIGAGHYWLDRDKAANRQARIKRRTNRALTILSAIAAAAAIGVLALR